MTSETTIQARGFSKRYILGSTRHRATTLVEALRDSVLRRSEGTGETLWALRDVTFDVRRGEVVGVIGPNGSGKTTLLKILSRITDPTSGEARIHGRVGSLLEVGTGFHPELTGKENIFLSGAILGMHRVEVARTFDAIAEFAELERFLETPVKRYSSGMYMRLAFAVAAHLDTEVLFIDEVLAVGDMRFQEKCLGRMDELAKAGRTVLFVSHNLSAISRLTTRALVLSRGQVVFDGDTPAAILEYRRSLGHGGGEGSALYAMPSKTCGVTRARVRTSSDSEIHQLGKPLSLEFEIHLPPDVACAAFSVQIADENLRAVAHSWLVDSDQRWSKARVVRLRCTLPEPKLFLGRYVLTTHLADRGTLEHLETLHGICPFEIVLDDQHRDGYPWRRGDCVYLERFGWEVIEPASSA